MFMYMGFFKLINVLFFDILVFWNNLKLLLDRVLKLFMKFEVFGLKSWDCKCGMVLEGILYLKRILKYVL